MGCSNFYRKGKDKDTSNFKEDNIEYDIIEPPEPSPDPQVPTTGAEFSSDYTANVPDQRNALGGMKKYKNEDESKYDIKEENIEYDIVEPPEPSPDPQVPNRSRIFFRLYCEWS